MLGLLQRGILLRMVIVLTDPRLDLNSYLQLVADCHGMNQITGGLSENHKKDIEVGVPISLSVQQHKIALDLSFVSLSNKLV